LIDPRGARRREADVPASFRAHYCVGR
jgi:hypothetical protein